MREAFWIGLVSLLGGAILTAALAQSGVSSTAQQRASVLIQQACVLTTNFTTPAGVQGPVRIYKFTPMLVTAQGSVPTTAPGLIGLAWGPDDKLYGVSAGDAPAGYQSNSLYRIDPSLGTTTLIGSTGLGWLHEGDLATDPLSGTIYGIDRERLFRFPGLTATSANPTAQIVGSLHFPPFSTNWDVSGLAFDPAGRLYALTQTSTQAGPPAHLIRLDLDHVANGEVPVISSTMLSRRFAGLGGLEFVNGALLYADGGDKSVIGPGSQNAYMYSLYAINMSTGAVSARGPTNLPDGVSSMVVCRTPACVTPPFGMAAWYSMEGNGSDQVSGQIAAVSGQVTFPPGRVRQSARFQGGYMAVPDGPALDQGLGDFSIDMWINIPAGQIGVQAIVDKRSPVANNVYGWVLFLQDKRLGLQLADGTPQNFLDGRTMSPGWHHIAVTVDRDSGQGVRFYVDGAVGAPFDPRQHAGNLDNGSATWFGRNQLSKVSSFGLEMDEVEFFHRVLGQSELKLIVDAAQTGKCLPYKGPPN
jgi:hypothetical protein